MKKYLNITTGKLIEEVEESSSEEEPVVNIATRINGSVHELRTEINDNSDEEEVAEDAYEKVVRE